MNFLEENELEEKKVIFLNYLIEHDEEKGIWNFDVALNKDYHFLFEDAENNNIGLIFSKQNKIILNSPTAYFVLDNIKEDTINAFNDKKPFYFKIHNESIDQVENDIITVLGINPPKKAN